MSVTHVIAVGYATQALDPTTREHKRQGAYAEVLTEYHLVVLGANQSVVPRRKSKISKNFFLYATLATTRLGKVLEAIRLVRSIIKSNPSVQFVVSAQDPFETSVIVWLATFGWSVRNNVQLHGDFYSTPAWRTERWTNRIRQVVGLWFIKRADSVRVVSMRIKKSLLSRGIRAEKISVVPVPVDLAKFLSLVRVPKNSYKKDAEAHTFLYVGRLAPEKNLPLLLNAFAVVHKEYPQARLKIVGDGNEKEALKKMIANAKLDSAVTMYGWTHDIELQMQKADTLCVSSSHEGYALVILEGMASGLAIITTEVGCVGECLESGVEGQVVKTAVADYAEAMCRYCQDPKLHQEHQQNARRRARDIMRHQKDYLYEWKEALEGNA